MLSRSYFPILKTKAGELWAIRHLREAVKDVLTPLFEINRQKDRLAEDQVANRIEAISKVWPNDQPFYLDTVWIQETDGSASLFELAFAKARTLKLKAIPVVRFSYNQTVLDTVRAIHELDGRGYLFRIPQASIGAHPAINAVADYVGVQCEEVDLMLDYRNHPMTLASDVDNVPRLNRWRRFIAASGVFPKSLSSHPLHTWITVPRYDWTTWRKGVDDVNLSRRPTFGDYATRDPGPPAEGGLPSACLRYSFHDHWTVRVGRKVRDGYSTDMFAICSALVESGHFFGAGYSEGDRWIADMAAGACESPAGAQQWLQWGLNHHMTLVVEQLQAVSI